jgi:hypothetical protein
MVVIKKIKAIVKRKKLKICLFATNFQLLLRKCNRYSFSLAPSTKTVVLLFKTSTNPPWIV